MYHCGGVKIKECKFEATYVQRPLLLRPRFESGPDALCCTSCPFHVSLLLNGQQRPKIPFRKCTSLLHSGLPLLESRVQQLVELHFTLLNFSFFSFFSRLTVQEDEEAMKSEQTRVQELQQELEQERALSLRKDKEEEERRGVRLE